MDHNYIITNEIIDKYLLHQLQEGEESEFEEHILFCEECMETLEQRKATIGIIRNELPKEMNLRVSAISKKNKKPKLQFNFFLKIAASIILIVSFTWFGIYLFNKNGEEIEAEIIEPDNKDSVIEEKKDSIIENKIIEKDIKEKKLLAVAYRTMPEFENYIKNPVRGEELKVLSPKLNSQLKQNKELTIKWESSVHDSLNFVVFDNKANVVFEKKIASIHKYLQKLKPGLYYWQLETDDESLFTSKFTIK